MINNINDISIFLKPLQRFQGTRGISSKKFFSLLRKDIDLIQWTFSYDEVFAFGIQLNLFEEQKGRINLTNFGLDVVKMYTNDIDLNSEQKKYIVENCIFGNQNFKLLLDFLKLFIFDQDQNTFVLNTNENPIPKQLQISMLNQFDIITKNNDLWIVNQNYVQNIELIKYKNIRKITQRQLDDILDEQKRIGDLAEELTVKYEKNRLQKKHMIQESQNVQNISKSYVNRGYDIESFSTKSIKPNLFIEVKGRKKHLNSFIISDNEVKTAKKLGNNYVIYFWNNLGDITLSSSPTMIIPDPCKNLALKECENCLSYLVDLTKYGDLFLLL